MDDPVLKLHIESNKKMMSNIENEHRSLKKLEDKLVKQPDLEFQLIKKNQDMNDSINYEKSKTGELLK